MSAPVSSELEILVRVCSAVQQVVRDSSSSPHRADVVGLGADGSPTEELDREAENRLLALLEEEGVDWNVVSEEAGWIDRGGERTLVVDPIDGSHNALRGLPFHTISVALGGSNLGGIDLGVVRDLSRGTTYWAIRGQGAYRDGQRIRTRPWAARAEIFYVNLGRHATRTAVELAAKGRRIRSLGCASFEMAMVAQGGADAYFFDNEVEARNLRVTDIAAAYRIVLEAGGGVTDARGKSLETFPLDLAHHTSVFAWGDATFAAAATQEGYV